MTVREQLQRLPDGHGDNAIAVLSARNPQYLDIECYMVSECITIILNIEDIQRNPLFDLRYWLQLRDWTYYNLDMELPKLPNNPFPTKP